MSSYAAYHVELNGSIVGENREGGPSWIYWLPGAHKGHVWMCGIIWLMY